MLIRSENTAKLRTFHVTSAAARAFRADAAMSTSYVCPADRSELPCVAQRTPGISSRQVHDRCAGPVRLDQGNRILGSQSMR